MKEIGKLIKQLRTDKNISQRALSRLSGVSNAEISRIEAGIKVNLNYDIVDSLLKVLDDNYYSNSINNVIARKYNLLNYVYNKGNCYISNLKEELTKDGWSVYNSDNILSFTAEKSGEKWGVKSIEYFDTTCDDSKLIQDEITYFIGYIAMQEKPLDRYSILVNNKNVYEKLKNSKFNISNCNINVIHTSA